VAELSWRRTANCQYTSSMLSLRTSPVYIATGSAYFSINEQTNNDQLRLKKAAGQIIYVKDIGVVLD
jgi:hypothetical protein